MSVKNLPPHLQEPIWFVVEKKKEKLDPVGKADADIDNDGVPGDPNDIYLRKRRDAITKAVTKKEIEEVASKPTTASKPKDSDMKDDPVVVKMRMIARIARAQREAEKARRGFKEEVELEEGTTFEVTAPTARVVQGSSAGLRYRDDTVRVTASDKDEAIKKAVKLWTKDKKRVLSDRAKVKKLSEEVEIEEGKRYAISKDGVRKEVKTDREAEAWKATIAKKQKAPRARASVPVNVGKPEVDLLWLARTIQQVVMAAYPDSDGWDSMYKQFRAKYPHISVYDISDYIQKATKKHLGANYYQSYVDRVHDSLKEGVELEEGLVGIHHGASALKKFADQHYKGDSQHKHLHAAAAAMQSKDHKQLKSVLRGMDTAVRDDALDHIHPDHWEGLGYEPAHHSRAVKAFYKKFNLKESEMTNENDDGLDQLQAMYEAEQSEYQKKHPGTMKQSYEMYVELYKRIIHNTDWENAEAAKKARNKMSNILRRARTQYGQRASDIPRRAMQGSTLPKAMHSIFVRKEELELGEAMTPAQMKKREDIVLSLKDKADEFKKKYGAKWKEVMYATATKQSMEEGKEEKKKDDDDDGNWVPPSKNKKPAPSKNTFAKYRRQTFKNSRGHEVEEQLEENLKLSHAKAEMLAVAKTEAKRRDIEAAFHDIHVKGADELEALRAHGLYFDRAIRKIADKYDLFEAAGDDELTEATKHRVTVHYIDTKGKKGSLGHVSAHASREDAIIAAITHHAKIGQKITKVDYELKEEKEVTEADTFDAKVKKAVAIAKAAQHERQAATSSNPKEREAHMNAAREQRAKAAKAATKAAAASTTVKEQADEEELLGEEKSYVMHSTDKMNAGHFTGKKVGTNKAHGYHVYAGTIKHAHTGSTSPHATLVVDPSSKKVVASHVPPASHQGEKRVETHKAAIAHAKSTDKFWSDKDPAKSFNSEHGSNITLKD